MVKLEGEKRRAIRDREEAEANGRTEMESLRSEEMAIKNDNQAILRYKHAQNVCKLPTVHTHARACLSTHAHKHTQHVIIMASLYVCRS